MKKLMMLVLVGALLSGGCQNGVNLSEVSIVKKDMTREEWDNDYLRCEYDAKKMALLQTPNYAGAPHPWIYPQIYKGLLIDCMKSKGYHIVPKGTPQNEW